MISLTRSCCDPSPMYFNITYMYMCKYVLGCCSLVTTICTFLVLNPRWHAYKAKSGREVSLIFALLLSCTSVLRPHLRNIFTRIHIALYLYLAYIYMGMLKTASNLPFCFEVFTKTVILQSSCKQKEM